MRRLGEFLTDFQLVWLSNVLVASTTAVCIVCLPLATANQQAAAFVLLSISLQSVYCSIVLVWAMLKAFGALDDRMHVRDFLHSHRLKCGVVSAMIPLVISIQTPSYVHETACVGFIAVSTLAFLLFVAPTALALLVVWIFNLWLNQDEEPTKLR
jgi:hypothetical protein